jgi:hypothetical protein
MVSLGRPQHTPFRTQVYVLSRPRACSLTHVSYQFPYLKPHFEMDALDLTLTADFVDVFPVVAIVADKPQAAETEELLPVDYDRNKGGISWCIIA